MDDPNETVQESHRCQRCGVVLGVDTEPCDCHGFLCDRDRRAAHPETEVTPTIEDPRA